MRAMMINIDAALVTDSTGTAELKPDPTTTKHVKT